MWNSRTELILGPEKLSKLLTKKVLVTSVGGVGAFAAEYLCRAGIKHITMIDNDIIDVSDINRQLPALRTNVGKSKVRTMANRLKDINPDAEIVAIETYLKCGNIEELLSSEKFDCVLDALDTLTPKVHLILSCLKLEIPLISAMGAGGKLDPTKIACRDISETYNCALSRAVRKKLKKHGVQKGVKAVFSSEDLHGSLVALNQQFGINNKKSLVGTISYMPACFACHCTAEVIKILLS